MEFFCLVVANMFVVVGGVVIYGLVVVFDSVVVAGFVFGAYLREVAVFVVVSC